MGKLQAFQQESTLWRLLCEKSRNVAHIVFACIQGSHAVLQHLPAENKFVWNWFSVSGVYTIDNGTFFTHKIPPKVIVKVIILGVLRNKRDSERAFLDVLISLCVSVRFTAVSSGWLSRREPGCMEQWLSWLRNRPHWLKPRANSERSVSIIVSHAMLICLSYVDLMYVHICLYINR